MNPFRALAAAFSYFSILPVRSFSAAPTGAVIGWLPLVGAAIGLLSGAAAWLVFAWTASIVWAVAVAFVASIVLSGAIHVDGFLDCSDALLMTAPPHRRLEVLHDPRHGTYAVVAMTVLSVVWLAALAQIPPTQMPLALALAATLSRASVVPLAQQYRHPRTGVSHHGTVIYGVLWFLVVAAAAVWLTHAWTALAYVVAAYLLAQLLAVAASRRIGGGITGDIYGAIVVVTEVALLIAMF